MLLINVFIKKLMKNGKNTNNFSPISDVLLSNVTKHSYKCLFFLDKHYFKYITHLFCHKSVQLSVGIFSFLLRHDSRKNFNLKQFNLMRIIHILVCLICTSDCHTKLNQTAIKCDQIDVLLQRDFRLKFLTKCLLYLGITMVS